MVWDRNYYVLEVEKQFSDCRIYQDVSNSENILAKLSQAVSKMVSALKRKVLITEEQLKYFTCEYKKATNFGKLYLLPKMKNQLFEVTQRPLILWYSYREMV